MLVNGWRKGGERGLIFVPLVGIVFSVPLLSVMVVTSSTASASSSAARTTSSTFAVFGVFVSSDPPVAIVGAVVAAVTGFFLFRLDAAGVDVIDFFVAVLFLAFDDELFSFPFGWRI